MEFDPKLKKLVTWLAPEGKLQKADIIFVFGGDSLELANKAAQIYNQHYAPHIILTGKTGTSGNKSWNEPIAIVLKKRLIELGIPLDVISDQSLSTNTLEDVIFSKDLIKKLGSSTNKIIIVAKPFQQLRAFATITKQLPQYTYINQPCAFDPEIDTLERIKERCAGEIERLRSYALKGDIITIPIPTEFE